MKYLLNENKKIKGKKKKKKKGKKGKKVNNDNGIRDDKVNL